MSHDPWSDLLEEYWDAIEKVGSISEAQTLRREYQNRLEDLMSSLELLDDLIQARELLQLGPIATEGIRQKQSKNSSN